MGFAAAEALPVERRGGLFLGRTQLAGGPSPILSEACRASDMAAVVPTVSALVEARYFPSEGGRPIVGPDGLALLSLGSSCSSAPRSRRARTAPSQDRAEPGRGFTHTIGDRVVVASPRRGRLVNQVTTSKAAAPWAEGIGALMRHLAGRRLLAPPATR